MLETFEADQVQNVVFDLGGVVLDWDVDAIVRAITDDVSMQRRIKSDVLLHPDWTDLDRGICTEHEAMERFARRIDKPIETMSGIMKTADLSMKVKSGTIQIMKDLIERGYGLYCLSNMPVERWAYLQETYTFWDLFQGIVISGHLKLVKPEPEIYQHLLDSYELAPESCLFLDDSPHNVEGARAVGMHSIVFTTPEVGRDSLAPLLT